MRRKQRPFDPLRFLQGYMRLEVSLDIRGNIVVDGRSRLEPEHWKQVRWVLNTYDKLLRMQLDAPDKELRPSVRKLLAQGKIVIRGGRYVVV